MSFNCWKIRKMCGFALLSFYPINSIRKISNYFEWNGAERTHLFPERVFYVCVCL